jgi:hypothetical protein
MEDLRLIMNLSSIITGVPEYIEYGWVTAPNAAGQSIAANTITTLTINTAVSATAIAGTYSSIANNQITLSAGTYYFEASVSTRIGASANGSGLLSLYNTSDSSYITRGRIWDNYAGCPYSAFGTIKGQFAITSQKIFDLRILTTLACTVDNGASEAALSTLSTAGADQRTTIKLWKLK